MNTIIEIRSYQLKAGSAARFEHLMREQSLPLLDRAGMAVLAAVPSLHCENAYLLMRGYKDLQHRAESQDEFYRSQAWLRGPRDGIMDCIESYNTVVVPAHTLK